MTETPKDLVLVLNTHTAKIADVPAGATGTVERWVADMFPALIPQDGPQEPGEDPEDQEEPQEPATAQEEPQEPARDGFGSQYPNGMRGDRAQEYIAAVEDPEDDLLNALLGDNRSTVADAAAARLRKLEGL